MVQVTVNNNGGMHSDLYVRRVDRNNAYRVRYKGTSVG